ncbi:conserved protein, unknown function [Hepatocystis sp. ex Piliocolobus tephrosceles]|nr:conserved protein, unknown function [Hepatocystis sp. ex Piliocolobus tephrosceles]
MIHEIILSLIGQTGDVIILVDKKKTKNAKANANTNNININEYGFEVNNNIHIFLNSEVKLINEIVELGYYFYIINMFCLLVKKNTIYRDLTHIHKFNKINKKKVKKKKEKNRKKVSLNGDQNNNPDGSSSSYASSSSFSSSESESGSSGYSVDSSETNNNSSSSNNVSNSYKKRKGEKKTEIDNYFGVVLKNVKSLNSVRPYGYYANGICNEINKFNERYLKRVSEIEEYINNNSNTPLTQILSMLEKKREEIIIIIDIIKNYLLFQKQEEVNVSEGESRNKTKKLLDYLYEQCLNGNIRIKNVYHKYFKTLGKIFLHQIFAWILYGQLIDPYYEFFIQKRQFIYTDDKKLFLSPEELYENLTLTNVQSLNFEWNYLFFQSISNLPNCCMDKINGRKILFIGKSIRILIRSNKWNTSDIIKMFSITKILSKAFNETSHEGYKKKHKQTLSFMEDDSTRRNGTYRNDVSDSSSTRASVMDQHQILHNCFTNFENPTNGLTESGYIKESRYDDGFNITSESTSTAYSYEYSSESENETLNLYCKEIFDITIEKIRTIIAYKLWKYIVKDINLIKIFDLFRDIYFLNNGDFYDYFLEKSWSIMHTPPNTKNEILLKILAWKNASLSVEDYFKTKYESKKDKLVLEKYENGLFSEYTNSNLSKYNDNNSKEYNSFLNTNDYNFDGDFAENIISRYFYPRISYKKFSYDCFEKEKYENLILGGMSYIYDNKIILNDFYKGIQMLYKKKYYDYDTIFSVCINNYRQQILRGFKHGFDFAVNFNNFFDNKFVQITDDIVSGKNVIGEGYGYDNVGNSEELKKGKRKNFTVGCCFSLVIHSVKNPLLYKTDILDESLGYWGSLGDCLSVEIRVKFYEKEQNKNSVINGGGIINHDIRDNSLLVDNKMVSAHETYDSIENSLNKVVLGDVEVEVSLFIGGEGISSFVHNSNSYTFNYTKESILNNKLFEGNIKEMNKRGMYDDVINGVRDKDLKEKKNKQNRSSTRGYNNHYEGEENYENENEEDGEDDNDEGTTRFPVLKIQSNKQIFPNINKNSLTKFRVRINCIKHSFSVYIQKLDDYNLYGNNPKNKIKPIIHIRALDMTQAFSLNLGNGYIGFYTCPILFKHKLLKKKSKLNEWFKRFYNNTLNTNSVIFKKNFFHVDDEMNKNMAKNEIENINKMIVRKNGNDYGGYGNRSEEYTERGAKVNHYTNSSNIKKMKNVLLFSSYDCSVEIYKWFHQSYKSPIEIPEIDIDNETLIFYDKEINKNIKIHSGLNLWNNIEIHFKLTWPIALIINTNTIYTYNSIFQFFFLLSRVYYNLKILCNHNRRLYKFLYCKKGKFLFSYLFAIRHKMQFFISHLIKYLQEDIINYEYKLMIQQVHKSKDFEYTKSIHDLFISQIATKCFLRIEDLTKPLLESIDTCFKFCYFFQCLIENELFTDIINYEMVNEGCENGDGSNSNDGNGDGDGDESKESDLNQVIQKLLQYNDMFNKSLIKVINEMMNISSNSNHGYLVHLLTTFDFNNYITKVKEVKAKEQADKGDDAVSESGNNISALNDTYNDNINGDLNNNDKESRVHDVTRTGVTTDAIPGLGKKYIKPNMDEDIKTQINALNEQLEKRKVSNERNIQFGKRDDNKMEYTDIEGLNNSDNNYLNKKDIYADNTLPTNINTYLNNMTTNISNEKNKSLLQNKIVNKFSNLLHSNNVGEEYKMNQSKLSNEQSLNNLSFKMYQNSYNGMSNLDNNVNNFGKYNYYSNMTGGSNNSINNSNSLMMGNKNYIVNNRHNIYMNETLNDERYKNNNYMNSVNNDLNNNVATDAVNNSNSNSLRDHNILLEKYSNILNSHMSHSNNNSTIYNSALNLTNTANLDSYKSMLDTSKVQNLNNTSSVLGNNNNYNNVSGIDIRDSMNSMSSMYNREMRPSNNVNTNSKKPIDINYNKITTDNNPLIVQASLNNTTASSYNNYTGYKNIIDTNIKNKFNVQNLLNNYNYSYDSVSNNNSLNVPNLSQFESVNTNISNMYNNVTTSPKYANMSLNMYSQNDSIVGSGSSIDSSSGINNNSKK